MAGAGLRVETARTVSHFRAPLLKRLIPPRWLAAADGLVQFTGRWWQLTPSVFVRAHAQKPPAGLPEGFFCCPVCRCADLTPQDTMLICSGCGRRWQTAGGIYDFKTPLAMSGANSP